MRALVLTAVPHRCDALVHQLNELGLPFLVTDSPQTALERLSEEVFGIALLEWDDAANSVNLKQASIQKPLWSIAVSVAESVDRELVFESGYDAWMSWSSGPKEIAAQVARARNFIALEARLSQASKLESIGQLAAGIAHEINTPIQYVGDNTRFVHDAYDSLCKVISQVEKFLEKECSADDTSPICETHLELRQAVLESDFAYLSEEVPIAIEQTLEGIQRVAQIVRAMKEFAHPGDANIVLTDLAVAIENTLTVARNEWKYVAEAETEFDPALPLVPCMPGELNQVILNLVVNAAHAIAGVVGETPASKGRIKISTRLARPYAEIRVSDTGTGIAPENLTKIFAPFFTTKPPGRGTGQGLAIAHNVIVEKHGGSIHVESKVGVGTTFVIRLPLEIQDSSWKPKHVVATSQ